MANKIQIEIDANNRTGPAVDAATRSIRAMEASVAAVSSLFAGSAIAAGIVSMTTKYASMAEELGKLRSATGLTYRQLQALRQALEEAGSSPEALNTATRILNVNIAQGDKTLAKYGITARDTYGAILQVGQRLASTASAAEKSELAMAAFGRSSQDLIDTISRFATDSGMRAGLEAAGISDAGIERLKRVDESIDRLGRSWKRLGNSVAEVSAGPVGGFLNLINGVIRLTSTAKWVGGNFFGGFPGDPNDIRSNTRRMGDITVEGAEVYANRPASGSAGAAAASGHFVRYPQYGYGPGLRSIGGGFFDDGLGSMANRASRYLALFGGDGGSGGGMTASQDRTRRSIDALGSGVVQSFTNMFTRIFSITTRSNNAIVNLFVDLGNAIVSALENRLGSAIGNFIVTAVGSAFGLPAAGATTTINVNTIEAKSLVDAALAPSGAMRQANVRLNQIAAVR